MKTKTLIAVLLLATFFACKQEPKEVVEVLQVTEKNHSGHSH